MEAVHLLVLGGVKRKKKKNQKNNIKLLYPCHCVSLQTKIEMGKEIKIDEVGVGLEINI